MLKYTHLKWLKNTLKLSTMVGENFEIYSSQVDKKYLNRPPWLEKILKYTHLKWLKNKLKLSNMVRENFEIYSSQVAKKCT